MMKKILNYLGTLLGLSSTPPPNTLPASPTLTITPPSDLVCDSVQQLPDYTPFGVKFVQRPYGESGKTVMGFVLADADEAIGALIPFTMRCDEHTKKYLNVFPSKKSMLPTLTILTYLPRYDTYYKLLRLKISEAPSEYVLFNGYLQPKKYPPAFMQLMFIERIDISPAINTADAKQFEWSLGKSKRGKTIEEPIHTWNLSYLLETHGKGPYVVYWNGHDGFFVYSIKSPFIRFEVQDEDDDD